MVIKYMRTVGIPIPLDTLSDLHWVVAVTDDPAYDDMGLGFSWSIVSSGGIFCEPFSSSSGWLVSAGVILKGPMKGLNGGSSPYICTTLSASSSNNIPLLCACAASTSLFSSLTSRASWAIYSIVSNYSSIVITLNLVILGLALLWSTSSHSWAPFVKISSSKLSWAYGQ